MVRSADIISTDRVGGGPVWWLLLVGKALSLGLRVLAAPSWEVEESSLVYI